MVLGMFNPASNRVRGELLREWRFSQNWDVTDLARRANLSIGQIQQLETGGTSLFYSAAIRENAARKVAILLGADPDAVIRTDGVSAAPASEVQVVHDLVALSRQRAQVAPTRMLWSRHAGAVLTVLASLAVLAAAGNWLQQKWQNGGAQQFWREAAVPAPVVVGTVQADASPAQAASEALGMAAVAEHTPGAQAAVALTQALAQPSATVAPSAAATVAPSTASSRAPSVMAPAPAGSSALAVAAPATAATASPSALANTPAAATASAAVANAGHPLCQQPSTGHVVTPVRPSKAGDMVYVVAQKIGSVCVVDAAGVRTVLSLKPQEARSVYGVAPWRVNFEQPEQAQLYFQGERLRFPGASVTTVALREASLAP